MQKIRCRWSISKRGIFCRPNNCLSLLHRYLMTSIQWKWTTYCFLSMDSPFNYYYDDYYYSLLSSSSSSSSTWNDSLLLLISGRAGRFLSFFSDLFSLAVATWLSDFFDLNTMRWLRSAGFSFSSAKQKEHQNKPNNKHDMLIDFTAKFTNYFFIPVKIYIYLLITHVLSNTNFALHFNSVV